MSAFEDDDELEFQSNPLAQEQALAADSAADADDGMESFQANPLREVWQTAEQHRRQPSSDMRRRLMGLDSDDLNDGSQHKSHSQTAASEPPKPAATRGSISLSSRAEKRPSTFERAHPAASASVADSAADGDDWSLRRAWLRRNLPSIEVISVVSLLSLLLNLFLLLAVVPSLRSQVSYMQGQTDSLQATVGNINTIVSGMGSRIDMAQAQILGFHSTADAVMHRVALASSALDLKVASAQTAAENSKRPAADRCGN